MKFPNAARGFNKIFIAEILSLISVVAMIVGGGIFVGGLALGNVVQNADGWFLSGSIGAIICGVVAVVLAVISFFMTIVGYINASHDDVNFKTALIFLLISIVLSIVSVAFSTKSFSSFIYSLSTLCTTIATIFVIAGGVKFADQLNRGEVSRTGSTVLKLIIVIEIATFVIGVVSTFLRNNVVLTVSAILFIAIQVLNLIKYITYLVFLNKAKKMFAKAKKF